MKSCKGKFPFRIGCTSYTIPADVLPNVEAMAPIIDDIEIVLFESSELSNLPDVATINELGKLAREHSITYSIHFPIDKRAGSESKQERDEFFSQVESIVLLTQKLPVSAYVTHLEGIDCSADVARKNAWTSDMHTFCEALEKLPVPKNLFSIENLRYPPDWNFQIVDMNNVSYCIDLGHMWINNQDWISVCEQKLSKTRVIHLHGVSNGTDHLSLVQHDNKSQLAALKEVLSNYKNVVTIEVFDQEQFFGSLETMVKLWEK